MDIHGLTPFAVIPRGVLIGSQSHWLSHFVFDSCLEGLVGRLCVPRLYDALTLMLALTPTRILGYYYS